jgi:hypothetical protein
MKVVINSCFGGFSLSPEALLLLWERGMTSIGTPVDEYWPPEERGSHSESYEEHFGYTGAIQKWREHLASPPKKKSIMGAFLNVFTPDEKYVLSGGREIERHSPELIRVVEELGERANGSCAKLVVVEIPDGVDYVIEEYDGSEHIAESHRTWR